MVGVGQCGWGYKQTRCSRGCHLLFFFINKMLIICCFLKPFPYGIHPYWTSPIFLDKVNLLQPSSALTRESENCWPGLWFPLLFRVLQALFLWCGTFFWPKASFRLTVCITWYVTCNLILTPTATDLPLLFPQIETQQKSSNWKKPQFRQ